MSLKGDIECEYQGLTSKNKLAGHLHSNPCVWKLVFKGDNNDKIIFVSLTNKPSGVACQIVGIGQFKLLIIDDKGNDAASTVIHYSNKSDKVGDLLKKWTAAFDQSSNIWKSEHGSK